MGLKSAVYNRERFQNKNWLWWHVYGRYSNLLWWKLGYLDFKTLFGIKHFSAWKQECYFRKLLILVWCATVRVSSPSCTYYMNNCVYVQWANSYRKLSFQSVPWFLTLHYEKRPTKPLCFGLNWYEVTKNCKEILVFY